MNGPWMAPRLLMIDSTAAWCFAGTWSLLVIDVNLAMLSLPSGPCAR